SPYNSYSHSMSWFAGRLFVGTFRNSLCLMNRQDRTLPPPKMEFWPVHCPIPEDPESLRAEVLAFDPVTAEWEVVHRSTLIQENGRTMPRDLGYRGMGIYQGKSDAKPCLYVANISRHGCTLLRSEDGRRFEDTARVLEGVSMRTLLACRGKFYTSL